MSLPVSHWIYGYHYDEDGNPRGNIRVIARALNGTDTVVTYTTYDGYYQINVQDICNEGDLVLIRFLEYELPFGENPESTDEFVRVYTTEMTQEVNSTLQNHIKINSDNYYTRLPCIKWNGLNGNLSKNTELISFRSGAIAVVDRGINNESIILQGYFYIDGIYTRDTVSGKVEGIVNLQNIKDEITISNFDDDLNGTYVIKSFIFDSIKGTPHLFTWKMELEYVTEVLKWI